MSEDLKNKMREVGEGIGNYSHETGVKIGKLAAETEDYLESGKKYIKENPVQSVIVAGALGIVIGSLVTYILKKKRQE